MGMDWAHCILKQGQSEGFRPALRHLARKPLALPLSNARMYYTACLSWALSVQTQFTHSQGPDTHPVLREAGGTTLTLLPYSLICPRLKIQNICLERLGPHIAQDTVCPGVTPAVQTVLETED